jgi:two-component system, OmpR family, sensor histidine kinase KdpD
VARTPPTLADERPPPARQGLLVAAVAVAGVTLVDVPLDDVAPPVSLGVVYLLAVLLVSSVWGPWLGVLTAVVSALAFNFFHLPPTGRFTIAEGENWVALGVFFVAALVASTVAERARRRAREADQRRREADLAAELARLLLRGELRDGLPLASRRLAQALRLPSAAIELRAVEGDERRVAFALREGAGQIGTLLVPAGLPETTLRRLQERVVPSLEALLAAARERDELLGDVVETRALRRSDVVKTALLRAVSHDLRSPLTAILAAAGPLGAEHLDDPERRELAGIVGSEAERLARLIEQLLDLSRLQAGAAEAHPEWSDLGEVAQAAADELGLPDGAVRVQVAADTPPLRFDPAQLQRALVNLLGNAWRYSDGHPVQVRAAPAPGRVRVRIVDQGPGIPQAQRERVFEPFYRAGTERTGFRGSGLGLAIARGFIEANGGRIWAESLPGQGTTFVVELPLPERAPEGEPAPVSA